MKVTAPSAAHAALLFSAFASAYFLSALLRAVTATLAPVFSAELDLQAADLGLLAGAYFLGFSALQLPLGWALDRHGPKRVLVALLFLGVVGCGAFAVSTNLGQLFAARLLIGMGVSGCLMAPLTYFRHRFDAGVQLRVNSWMLMTGSFGMVASTVPVQALLPYLGWRNLFFALAVLLAASAVLIARVIPGDEQRLGNSRATGGGYREIVRHPVFLRNAPLGFTLYGGLVAIQALWAGPWLTRVAGWTAAEAAQGLMLINLCMLAAFMAWGALMPKLTAAGFGAVRLMTLGLPLCLAGMAVIVLQGQPAGAWMWAGWCVACSVVSLSQPAVGQAFPPHLAGRALSAFNLVIFLGIFAIQWGIGLIIDAARSAGADEARAFRLAFGLFGASGLAAYLWFVLAPRRRPERGVRQ